MITVVTAKPSVLDIQTKCEIPGLVAANEPATFSEAEWQGPLFNVSSFVEVGVITVCLVEKLLFSLTQAYLPSPTCPAGRFLTPIRLIHDLERFAAPETHLQLEFRHFNISRRMSSSTRAQLGVLYPRIVHRLAQSVSAAGQYFGRNWRVIYRFVAHYLWEVLHLPMEEASFQARDCLFRFYLSLDAQHVVDDSIPEPLETETDASSSLVAEQALESEPLSLGLKCELHHNGEELEEHCVSLEAESLLGCAQGRSCRLHTFDGYRCHCPAF